MAISISRLQIVFGYKDKAVIKKVKAIFILFLFKRP